MCSRCRYIGFELKIVVTPVNKVCFVYKSALHMLANVRNDPFPEIGLTFAITLKHLLTRNARYELADRTVVVVRPCFSLAEPAHATAVSTRSLLYSSPWRGC